MNPVRKWFFIIRPFTLSASISPVLAGISAAATITPEGFGSIRWPVALITLFCAVSLQILSNLINDYCDFRHGSDTSERLGPPRAVSLGIISPQSLIRAISTTAILSIVSGGYLIYIGGWPIAATGASALLFAWLYSATRFSLSHMGIADIFALSYYGFIASVGTTFLLTDQYSPLSLCMGVACGCIAVAILTTNNIRDVREDSLSGKKTLIVRFGTTFGKILYSLCITVPPVIAASVLGNITITLILTAAEIPLLLLFFRSEGRKYNRILLLTGLYDLLFAVSVTLSAFFS